MNNTSRMQRGIVLLLMMCVPMLIGTGLARSAELHVAPSGAPYTTIQAAIDAAAAGDRVLIAEGTYNTLNSKTAPDGYTGPSTVHQIVFIDKTLSISGGYNATFSQRDPELYPTIIDGFNQTRCIFVSHCDPVIEGVRIRNGNANGQGGSTWTDAGGGIYALLGSPIFLDSLVTNCRAGAGGGAFLASCDYFNLIRVDFVSNLATDIGGGFETLGSDGYIDGCLVLGNISERIGGGGYLSYSSPDMIGCEFRNNSSGDLAGGLGLYDTWATIADSTFINNTSDDGGGIWCSLSTASIDGNRFLSNTAEFAGGGLYLEDGEDTIVNSIFALNRVTDAAGQGSGVLCAGGMTTFVHNTFAGNTGGTESAMELVSSLTGPASASALNTITSDQDVGYLAAAGSSLTFDYALWHNTTWDYGGAGTIAFGTHLFHGDPLYRDAPHLDFHITSGSAARDVGGDAGIDHDVDDQLRPWDSGYDIGADEYHYSPARGVRIECPLSIHPGESFFVNGFLINNLALQPDMYVFFLLDIGGEYWFWPSWSHYSASDPSSIDFVIRDVASGETRVYVLNPFTWPDTGGAAMSGLRFWGAIVDPASMTLFGELAVVSWAFS